MENNKDSTFRQMKATATRYQQVISFRLLPIRNNEQPFVLNLLLHEKNSEHAHALHTLSKN
jgi:hypothetical protein